MESGNTPERLKSKQKKNSTLKEIETFIEEEEEENLPTETNQDLPRDISIEVPLLSKSKTCNFSGYDENNRNEPEQKQVEIIR